MDMCTQLPNACHAAMQVLRQGSRQPQKLQVRTRAAEQPTPSAKQEAALLEIPDLMQFADSPVAALPQVQPCGPGWHHAACALQQLTTPKWFMALCTRALGAKSQCSGLLLPAARSSQWILQLCTKRLCAMVVL